MSDSKILSQDFSEFIKLLNVHDVRYLVTGGYAVAIYGHPRYTGDMGFWINATAENANKLICVLKEFGMASFGLTSENFTTPEQIIQMGYPPYRIDILTSIDE